MIKYNVIYCDDCGSKIEPGNRPDGVPNGVRFQYKDGTSVDVCAACIIIRKGGIHLLMKAYIVAHVY